MDDSAYIFRQRIREVLNANRARGTKPSSPAELAKRINQRPESIYNLLRATGAPTLETVDRVASGLNMRPDELLRPSGVELDHTIDECYRRIGEAFYASKKPINPREAARVLRDYLKDKDGDVDIEKLRQFVSQSRNK